MAAAISFSGSAKSLNTETVNITGASNNTAYVLTLAAQGHTQTINLTTNGSGAASPTFVPWIAGTYTATLTPATSSAAATATFNVGGHC